MKARAAGVRSKWPVGLSEGDARRSLAPSSLSLPSFADGFWMASQLSLPPDPGAGRRHKPCKAEHPPCRSAWESSRHR